MNCQDYRELLISRLCGEIEKDCELELKNHLETCQECKQDESEYRIVQTLVQQVPDREWDEKLRIKDMLRREQLWRTMVFSKAALWIVMLTLFITSLTFLPVQWEASSNQFSVRWGDASSPHKDLSKEIHDLRLQLVEMQKQNQQWYQQSESRIKQLVEQNNIEQQQRYYQALDLFGDYLQLQRQADLQKIQHEIANTYNRTGQEVEKTNELLEYVIRASATDGSIYRND